MRNFVETTQTWCECSAIVAHQATSYNIKAEVKVIPAIGKRLIISINPPINSISQDELIFDGSRLPENMVADWLQSKLNDKQCLTSCQVIDSDKHDNVISIVN